MLLSFDFNLLDVILIWLVGLYAYTAFSCLKMQVKNTVENIGRQSWKHRQTDENRDRQNWKHRQTDINRHDTDATTYFKLMEDKMNENEKEKNPRMQARAHNSNCFKPCSH